MKEFTWTKHALSKMRQYGLSEGRIRRVINSPHRVEEGIAENTIAAMQRAGTEKNPYEIWVMISRGANLASPSIKNNPKLSVPGSVSDSLRRSFLEKHKPSERIISAWKYPGITKAGEPLPSAILRELGEMF